MKKPIRATEIVGFLRSVALTEVAVFAAVGLLWWIGGWRTPNAYGAGLVAAGIAMIILGAFSVAGGWNITQDARYQYVHSAGAQSIPERLWQETDDTTKSYAFVVVMLLAGGVSAVVGTLIQLAAR